MSRKALQKSSSSCASHTNEHFAAWVRGSLIFLLILTLTVVAYSPALDGQPIWDDDAHLTKASLRSFDGLTQIWINPRAAQQYYPVVHSFFWLEYHLWGDAVRGYHFVTIFFHAVGAFLFLHILRRLRVPGPWLAAAIFALHPIQVESVAWISELKNTLSGACFLGAAFVYLKFDQTRDKAKYGLALGIFILGLLSKTVIASLPAALLLVFWWQRGRLEWRRDVLPLMPFFVIGITSGLFTAWIEKTILGASGSEFNFTWIERCLIAGRVIWFYLGKLFWPTDLMFNYPRWEISQQVAWHYAFPAAACILIGTAMILAFRKKCRGLLVGLLLFTGTLFPALGFINVYPFRYSFVADHFSYLASLGIIALAAAGLQKSWKYLHLSHERASAISGIAIVGVLGLLTWRQAHIYNGHETIWQDTLKKNPASALAHNNYGQWLQSKGRIDEAMKHFTAMTQLYPQKIDGFVNLGCALFNQNRVTEAAKQFEIASKIAPDAPIVHFNIGRVLEKQGKSAEATREFERATELKPPSYEAHSALALQYLNTGQFEKALTHLQASIRINPDGSEAYGNWGMVLHRIGQREEAIAKYNYALLLDPKNPEAHLDLGVAFSELGRFAEAKEHFLTVLRIDPASADAFNNLADLAVKEAHYDEALMYSAEALRREPQLAAAHYNAGNACYLLGRLDDAIVHYQSALQINPDYEQVRNNLHAALTARQKSTASSSSR